MHWLWRKRIYSAEGQLLTGLMQKILVSFFTVAIIAIIIIGLINFDLMVELWVKLLVGVLFAGVLVTIYRALFQGK